MLAAKIRLRPGLAIEDAVQHFLCGHPAEDQSELLQRAAQVERQPFGARADIIFSAAPLPRAAQRLERALDRFAMPRIRRKSLITKSIIIGEQS